GLGSSAARPALAVGMMLLVPVTVSGALAMRMALMTLVRLAMTVAVTDALAVLSLRARRFLRRLDRKRDLVFLAVDVEHFDLHAIAGAHRLARVLDEAGGELRDVHEPVLMDADVHEGAEIGDIGHDARADHVLLEVLELGDIVPVLEGDKLLARVAARLFE